MRIGVPAEIKDNEYRVGMVPSGVRDLEAVAQSQGREFASLGSLLGPVQDERRSPR